ncbi:hypothetical protein FOZ62_017545 [Perkinsus olseni]|uniref:Uncharacterized protein n=1 Tax=Perkinsus olseni TaxID=32597 RepID=A0A7J6UGZ2_PEROL|nr:hypothetical protein FOZ62_017545 [Perkinsus olseni]
MVNMVENPSSEPSVNPVGLQIARAFGVENVYLLRHVTDEEFSKKCEEMLTEKKKTFADILAWCDYMEDIKNPRPQLCESSTASRTHGSLTSDEPDVVTARIVDTVSKLPLPDGEAYNGFQDRRSISWFVKEIQGTSKLFQLSCRAEWLFLTNACKPLVRSAMLKQVECDCGDEVWMHDYDQMLAVAEDYLTTKYRRSDDPSRYEARIINVRQRSAESVYAYLDRVTELVSQGQNCGLQLSPEQVCSAFRRGLLGRLRKTANVQFSTVTRASTLASELTRFSELNPWVLESSSTDRVGVSQASTTVNNNNNNANGTADRSSRTYISDVEFNFLRSNRYCIAFAKSGSCPRTNCRFTHASIKDVRDKISSQERPVNDATANTTTVAAASIPSGSTPLTATTNGKTDSKQVTSTAKYCSDDVSENSTLRVPQLSDFFVEVDTGCSSSIITSKVETTLIAAGLVLSTDVMKKTFSTASDELVATRQVTMCLVLLDAKSTEFMLYWQPYVIDTGLPGCDGLFGRDILQWGDTGLEVLTTDGLLSISKFLCTADELKCCQSTYRIKEDLLLPPDDNLVCDRDAMGPVDDDNDDTGTIASCADNVDPKLLKVNRLKNRDCINFDSVPLLLPDKPTFAATVDPILHVIYQNEWYRITTHETSTGSHYFAADISLELSQWMDKLSFKAVPRTHWRWLRADTTAKSEGVRQIESFISNGKLCRCNDQFNKLFASNFYAVKGRKRHRVVLPLLRFNAVIKYVMKRFVLTNPQHRMSVAITRMRLAPAMVLMDIADAFMQIHTLKSLSSKLVLWFRGQLWCFAYLIYGGSTAPATLEHCVHFLECICPDPSRDLPLLDGTGVKTMPPACSFMDDLVKPCSLVVQQQLQRESPTTPLGICEVSGDPTVSLYAKYGFPLKVSGDPTVSLYAKYGFPLKVQILRDDDENKLTSLGLQLTSSSITYRADKYQDLCNIDANTVKSYREGLRVLSCLTNESDVLPLQLLPTKHSLIGLLSAWRCYTLAAWDDEMNDDVRRCVWSWLELVKSSELPKVRRWIDPTADYDLFTDSSKYMQCYRLYYCGDYSFPVLQEQFVLTRGESSYHINTLELYCVWRALSRLQLVQCDADLKFSGCIRVHIDSRTVLSLVQTHRVSRGPYQALNQKYLDLVLSATGDMKLSYEFVASSSNMADCGTRCPLLQDILRLREDLRLLKAEQKADEALVVRLRSESLGDVDGSAAELKRRRVDSNAQSTSDDHNAVLPVSLDSYDFLPFSTKDPLVKERLEKLVDNVADGSHNFEPLPGTDRSVQLELARAAHSIAHESIEAVCSRLSKYFSFKMMREAVRLASNECVACMSVTTRPRDRQFKQPVVPDTLVPLPFYKVGMDVLGPYDSRFYVVTLCDYYSGLVFGRATTYCPSHKDVKLLLNSVYHTWGCVPSIVVSDNGSQFQTARRDFPYIWRLTPVRGSPSNGLTERQHRIINAKLRRFRLQGVSASTDRQWQDLVDRVIGEMNNAPRPKARGLCPLDILLDFPVTDILVGTRRPLPDDHHTLWQTYRERCFERSAGNIPHADQQIEPGDLVYLRCSDNAAKLEARYSPKIVKSVHGPNRIELDDGKVVHSKDLKVLRDARFNIDDDDDDDDNTVLVNDDSTS